MSVRVPWKVYSVRLSAEQVQVLHEAEHVDRKARKFGWMAEERSPTTILRMFGLRAARELLRITNQARNTTEATAGRRNTTIAARWTIAKHFHHGDKSDGSEVVNGPWCICGRTVRPQKNLGTAAAPLADEECIIEALAAEGTIDDDTHLLDD